MKKRFVSKQPLTYFSYDCCDLRKQMFYDIYLKQVATKRVMDH